MRFAAIPRSAVRPIWPLFAVLIFTVLVAVVAPGGREGHPHRLPEIRHADPAQGQGLAGDEAQAARLSGHWAEFPAGPPLLEALNAGAIDFGSVGETPPIFAQAAAGARLPTSRTSRQPHAARPSWFQRTAPIHGRGPEGQEGRPQQGFERALPARARARDRRASATARSSPSSCPRPTRAPPSSAARSTPG